MFMIALLALLLVLLVLRLLRPPPPPPPSPLPGPHLPRSPPRHVSFSLSSSDSSHSLPASLSPSLPIHRRWSPRFRRRAVPHAPQPPAAQNNPPPPVDQFGRLPSFDTHPSPKFARRLPAPLRFSKRGSSSISHTSASIRLDEVDARTPSPPPSMSAPPSSPSPQRTKFTNPFRTHSRSRSLSQPSTVKSSDPSSNPSTTSSPSSSLPRRRSLVNRFKSVLKSASPEPSPISRPKPIADFINTRLRRKPVTRTQPYGPPWNIPIPVPEPSFPQHSPQKHTETSRKHSVHDGSLPEESLMPLGRFSPRTFINELEEKLSLLQQQRIQDPILSPHE